MFKQNLTDDVANQPFLDWLAAQGVEFAACGLHRFDDRHGGRGVKAIKDIDQDEILISVPDEAAVLTPENCSIAEVVGSFTCCCCTPWQATL